MACDKAMLTMTVRGDATYYFALQQSQGQICLQRLSDPESQTVTPARSCELPAHCESRYDTGLTAPQAFHGGCADHFEEQESDLS